MRLSFRLRITLLSALLAGVALVTFATIALWQIRQTNLTNLEVELLAQAEREVTKQRRVEDWQRIERELSRPLGGDGSVALSLEGANGQASYHSSYWPHEVDVSELPWPRQYEAQQFSRPPLHRDEGRPTPRREVRPQQAGEERPQLRERPQVIILPWTTGDRAWRIALAATPDTRLALIADLRIIEDQSAEARDAFMLAIPLTLLIIVFGAWFLSGRALRPIRVLTDTISRVTAKGLDKRIDSAHADREFERMIEVFNQMLERLERSFTQASRFSADAAHELKTPLTILQGEVEQAINREGIAEQEQAALSRIMDEIQRLARILRKLLLLSRADAGRLRLHTEPYDLSTSLQELVEDAAMINPSITINATIPPSIMLRADRELMGQLLTNLISNAMKYNRDAGWIDIELSPAGGQIILTIRNASKTLSASTRRRLFERFYRDDPAHGRKTEGAGLGLSIAREVARAHGGELALTPLIEWETGFVLRIPSMK
ncbi:MAG: ATP-binding protein [Candidatus Thiodiazotropha sp.]|jgi:heavy metal sensor kinase